MPRLRGDLDSITLLALRKEPSQRYQTAEQFSEDISRFLAGEPVSARQATMVSSHRQICAAKQKQAQW